MWIKICGIRDAATVEALAEANAIGLNFYAHTPRNVSLKKAADIVEMLPESVLPVGLFVNAPPEEILSVCRRSSLRVVQLHGDETPEFLAELQRLASHCMAVGAFANASVSPRASPRYDPAWFNRRPSASAPASRRGPCSARARAWS
ncbi:MAG: phosphoribosylanthranilate isomerase, partial [Planctomycetes bacterium]|nr:phosphoribosylanthranilate isomerase [Planctomycetota bacterium]